MTPQTDLQAFRAALPQLLAEHEGQFVVMQGGKALHYSLAYADALEWAYEHLGLERFFVKQVSAIEDVAHFSRDLGLCAR